MFLITAINFISALGNTHKTSARGTYRVERGRLACLWPQNLRTASSKWPCFLSALCIIYCTLFTLCGVCLWVRVHVPSMAVEITAQLAGVRYLLSFYQVCPRDRTQVTRFDGKHFYALSHLVSPASSTSAIKGRKPRLLDLLG